MTRYIAHIEWECDDGEFKHGQYSRAHRWLFDGGTEVFASASPHIVPLPLSQEDAVDPEEAFVAAIASCHMLWFLSIASRNGLVVDAYRDKAEGVLSRTEEGHLAITRVTLRPRVTFSSAAHPSQEEHIAMHDAAHAQCFIARSVKTQIVCKPVDVTGEGR